MKCSIAGRRGGGNETLWNRSQEQYVRRSERLGWKREWINDCKKITRNCTQYFLAWVFLPFVHVVFLLVSGGWLLVLSCIVCNCCWVTVCIVVVFLLCCYLMCICCTVWALLFFFTLDAGLLARSQYSEGPATGHLDTGFSWFHVSISKCWDGSQHSKLPLHASQVALPTKI